MKFSDRLDTIIQPSLSSSSILNNSKSASHAVVNQPPTTNPPHKQIAITKDNFYGSPSKKSPCKSAAAPVIGSKFVSSFADRMKNTNGSALQRDMFSEESCSKLSTKAKPTSSSNTTSEYTSTSHHNPSTQSFLFSPMKRLRLDEVVLEKPYESMANTTLADNTITSESEVNMATPPRAANITKNEETSMNTSSSEFSDCLKLLNQAEKKVQNRLPPSTGDLNKPNSFSLSDKYFQSSGGFVDPAEGLKNFVNSNTATYSTMANTAAATISSSVSNASSMNSANFLSNSIHFQPNSTGNGNPGSENVNFMSQKSPVKQRFTSVDSRSMHYHQMERDDQQIEPCKINELEKLPKNHIEGINI